MPTERNNRQLSEISDSKVEERVKFAARHVFPDLSNLVKVFTIMGEQLQRETRRETLMEAAKSLWHGPGCPHYDGRKGKRREDRLYAVNELRRMAAELGRKAKGD